MKPSLYIPWILLILLSTAAYVAGINRGPETSLRFVAPLALAGIKMAIVAWCFMELRTVSRFWIFGVGSLTFVIFSIVAVLH